MNHHLISCALQRMLAIGHEQHPSVHAMKATEANMRFAEVNDPKGLCKDVTGVGRLGNGDTEVGLSKLDDLPYVMGLIRQSLDLQLGNGGDS